MKGRDTFTRSEAAEIRRLLGLVRRAEPGTPQKILRDQLRALGFYISDFAGGPAGFTPSDFDHLASSGRVKVTGGPPDGGRATARETSEPESAKASSAPRAARSRARSAPQPAAPAPGVGGARGATAAARAALSAEPLSIKAAVAGRVPNVPGLYALYGSAVTWRALGLGAPPDGRPLYAGKAEASLASRVLETHFATGKTGQSSPRRSFAALLSAAGVLELVAMPRRPHDPEPKKWTHYALEAPGDQQLTDWMCSTLRIAVWPSPPGTSLGAVEGEVMTAWLPPLNLIGVSTPWTAQVKTARAAMAQQARAWARKRGFDV